MYIKSFTKKKLAGKKVFSRVFFLYILNKAKKLKDKNKKNNFTVTFMVGAGKGVAALPVTIALYFEHILLVHVVSSSNFFKSVVPGPCSLNKGCNIQRYKIRI